MKIWGKYRGKVELIDTCTKGEAAYLVGEYQLAYGSQWIVWAGLKRDEPRLDESTIATIEAKRKLFSTWYR